MRKYEVVWEPSIEDELLLLWQDADKREQEAISRASYIVDRELAIAPETKGEVVAEGLLRYRIPPIVVIYHIEIEKRIVKVVGIRRA
jgi:mRNA-degrading endonuclease RelE of RelBE toxin-antitoxin system